MCTAISFSKKNHYFGRNLDLEYSYVETVTITPRNFPFIFRKTTPMSQHYAMIGMAYVCNEYPLYYEATNETGLSIAGLNFPENAVYYLYKNKADNIAPFELIPWILGQCATIDEAQKLLEHTNIWKENYNEQLPAAPLHWLIADKTGCLTVEAVADGLKIYENHVGVLTNNPPFPVQIFQLNTVMALNKKDPGNHFSDKIILKNYSHGMGAIGLPGDWSSQSRFVKAAFVKLNSVCNDSEHSCVNQFFHILDSVEFQRGCVELENALLEITQYSCCCNTDKCIYYYKTYDNSQITAIDMYKENLEGTDLIIYPLRKNTSFLCEN